MAENGEVGLFVDFENVRYGLKNNYSREPDPQLLMAKARKYGPVALALAYADFTEHPEYFRRKLEVAGINPPRYRPAQSGCRSQELVGHGDVDGHHRLFAGPAHGANAYS